MDLMESEVEGDLLFLGYPWIWSCLFLAYDAKIIFQIHTLSTGANKYQ